MTSTETLYQNEVPKRDSCKQQYEINLINTGDDEVEIYGYKRSICATTFTWVFIILSLGLLRLIFHWYPHWMLYMMYERCLLQRATKILIVESNKGLSKSYIVEDVKTISLNNVSPEDVKSRCRELNVRDLVSRIDANRSLVRIYLNDGSYIDSNYFKIFQLKKLFYIWCDEKGSFIRMSGMEKCVTKMEFHTVRGFSDDEQLVRRLIYGDNIIDIELESIFSLICTEVLTPFYIFQLFAIIIWFLEPYITYSCAIIAMTTFGIGSAVYQTRQNQKKLHQTVHSIGKILVCRNLGNTKSDAKYEEIFTNCLVPGDIIVIPTEGCAMPCDAVLISGSCIVNESMLTGESVPVTKTAIPCLNMMYNEKEDANHTVYGGTNVLQARYYADEYVHAVVVRTGFLTVKGSLVQSILYPVQHDFKFDQDILKVVWFLSFVALCGTVYSYVLKTLENETLFQKIIDSLDVITIIVPPALPAAMAVGKYYAVNRLKIKNISCMNPSAVNVAGSVNCVCFDKTGTLTEDGLDLFGVIPSLEGVLGNLVQDVKSCSCPELMRAMASCHSLTIINEEIAGDPLDVKMFESTNWILEEPAVTDSIKYDLLAPTIVKPPPSNGFKADVDIGLIHQFQFSSHLQRMSVITRRINLNDFTVYCKGSPEMIKSLCIPETVPSNMDATLHKYAVKGFRVIAVAYKIIPPITVYKLKRLHREEVENNLIFVGLILFENKLKPKTIPVINELQQAKIKILMLTGDNIQTAICVGRECGIIKSTDTILHVGVIENNKSPQISYNIYEDDVFANLTTQRLSTENGLFTVDAPLNSSHYKLVLTGNTWKTIKEYYPSLAGKIVTKAVVFARMSPDQKQQIIEQLISGGHYVIMCGDGANDCGALRSAHVGISLSEMESSVASAFTYRPDIWCVPQVIREGRAALVTSFGLFKFMVLYSVLEFFSTLLLYSINSTLSDFEFLFIDLCLIVVFGFFFGQGNPYAKPLVAAAPLSSLISAIPICSLLLQCIIMLLVQMFIFLFVRRFPWCQCTPALRHQYHIHGSGGSGTRNYENYAIFCISQFQYIILAVCFSQGAPYRESIYKNRGFFLSIVVLTAVSVAITVAVPLQFIENLVAFKYPPDLDFPIVIVCVALANLVVSVIVEDFLVNKMLYKFLNFLKRRKGYAKKNSSNMVNGHHSRKGLINKSFSISEIKNSPFATELHLSAEHLSDNHVRCYGTMNDNHVI